MTPDHTKQANTALAEASNRTMEVCKEVHRTRIREIEMKLVDNITVFPVITTLPLSVERVLRSAIDAKPKSVWVIGEASDGSLYFAASEPDGGDALWWMEKAKRALMEITE